MMDHPMSEEAEMAMPINSTYVHSHPHLIKHHHHHHHHDQQSPQPFNHIIPSSNGTNTNTTMEAAEAPDQIAVIGNNSESFPTKKIKQSQQQQLQQQEVVVVTYRECLKNHAAAMGGNATDGCGEFMPSGEEGTIEALTCSACNCHRNFHRKEIEGGDHNQMMMMMTPSPSSCDCYHHLVNNRGSLTGLGGGGGHGRKLIALPGHHHHNHHSSSSKVIIDAVTGAAAEPFGYSAGGHGGGGALVPAARSVPIMPYSSMAYLPSESDEQEGGGGGGGGSMGRVQTHQHHQNMVMKKRFRTKFTQEQKEKMFNFAEKVGWKIQKQEESVVQHFCEEIGVRRRVLKVWMHNNKHNLAKKQLHNSPSTA